MERIQYKYLFRLEGGETVLVVHDTRPGDAENCARKLAKLVGKREKSATVSCVWKGAAEQKIPEEIRREIRKERTA